MRGKKITEDIILVCGDESTSYDNVVPSKAADAILDMAGIEAVFVVTKNVKDFVAISARSRSKVNVQRIMEALGGGGHFNLAAAQVYDQSIVEVQVQLMNKILEELQEE